MNILRYALLVTLVGVYFATVPACSFATSRDEVITQSLASLEFLLASNETPPVKPAPRPSPRPSEPSRLTIPGSLWVSGGYNGNHMHYKETSGQDTLDEDYGKLYGFYLEAGYKSKHYYQSILGKPFAELYFRRYDALILYDGATLLAPIELKERAEVQRFGAKFGAYGDFAKKGEVRGYFDIGRRQWYRGENDETGNYAEKYVWTYFGIGSGISYPFWEKFTAGVDAEMMWAMGSTARMRADLYEGGTFNLKEVWGAEIKFPLKYYFLKQMSLDVTPYFTYWSIKESDPELINGAYYVEPDSTTHIEGILAGFSYYF